MKKTLHPSSALFLLLLMSFTSQADELILATWNIAWLSSHEYNQRTEQDYRQLALYAKQLDADIIALQEVESSYWAQQVFGSDYDYYFSSKDWVQRVGVAVKKSQGFSVKTEEYKALDVGRVRYGMDITLTRNNKTLHLLAVHLKSGCFVAPLNKTSVNAMPSRTKKETKHKEACDKLSRQIAPLERWIDLHADQELPYIVLGDFNRRFSQEQTLQYAEDEGLWQALNDKGEEALWSPTTKINSACWGGYYKDYIDHILFSPQAKKTYVNASFKQLVFKPKYTQKLAQRLSDHCPISVKIKL